MTPQRIQLSRQKGWRKPEGAIVVARPTKWGNQFPVDDVTDRQEAVDLYRMELVGAGALDQGYCAVTPAMVRRELRGHDLCCWCPLTDEHGNRVPCHADVLLELANPGWRPDATS